MIILIGGGSHTGKTLLAQYLLEKYKIPYTSLDYLKMGLIRGYEGCGFALDNDDTISENMWGIVKGIIDTCHENKQNIILEGCYLPPDQVGKLIYDDVIAVYLVLSKEYIHNNFDKIIAFENVIEKRKYPEVRTESDFISTNLALKKRCIKAEVPYFEIKADYEYDIRTVYEFIHTKMLRLQNC
jgi:putative acetyltransferase